MIRSSRRSRNGSGKTLDPLDRHEVGMTLESGAPIWAPEGHHLLAAPGVVGKSACVAVSWLFSFPDSGPIKPLLIVDSKAGEITAQATAMLAKLGRKVAIIDEMGVLAPDHAERLSLNPSSNPADSLAQGGGKAPDNRASRRRSARKRGTIR